MRMKRKAEDRDREVIEKRPTILPNLIPENIGFINSYIGRPAGVLEFSSSEVIGGQCLIVLTESLAPRLSSIAPPHHPKKYGFHSRGGKGGQLPSSGLNGRQTLPSDR